MFYIALENRSIIKLTGDDVIDFLQGLISNDARFLLSGNAIYAAMLSPQGKFLHDFFIIKSDNIFFIDVAQNRKDDLLARLKLYRLRSKVEIEDATDLTVVALFGKDNSSVTPLETIITYPDPRTEKMGFRAILTSPSLLAREGWGDGYNRIYQNQIPPLPNPPPQGGREYNEHLYEKLRLYLTIPDTSDMLIDKSLLLECGFEQLHGVNFSKGCYVGQEVTARSKFRGQVRKSFYQISADVNIKLPPIGTPIKAGEIIIGELRTSYENIGIGIINIDYLTTAQNASGTFLCDGINIKISPPSWL